MKIISVIIPSYNREEYIADALDSVLTQHLPKGYELEVIVADDGSTDKTVDIVKRYKDVKLLELPHSGKPAVPRNAAIRQATGQLIAFQDSDDLWAKDKLISQVPVFDDPHTMLSFGNAEIMLADGTKTGKKILLSSALKTGETFSSLLTRNVISTLTVMVRAEALKEVGLFDEADNLRAVEDYQLWLRVLNTFPKGARSIPQTLAHYRTHQQNISEADSLTALRRLINVLESIEPVVNKPQPKAELAKQLFEMRTNWARQANELDPKNKPSVTVVMSVYNGERYLRPALESILKQTFKDFELLIIDDGSTDKSAKIIKSYKDPRINLISQANHGLVYSLNKGVALARGEFIARHDADDMSLPTRFAKQVKILRKQPHIGLVGTSFTYIDEVTEVPKLTICMPTKSLDVKRAMYVTNPIGHGTVMMRKSIFQDLEPYTNNYGPTEDFELWRRIADKWELEIIPEALYLYRLNQSSISHTKSDVQHRFTRQLIEEQWAKPLLLKSFKAIVSDGKFYRGLETEHAQATYTQYLAHQIDIAKGLLSRGYLAPGYLTAAATLVLRPKTITMLLKPALRAPVRKLRLWMRK